MSTARLVVGPSWVGDMVMAQSLFRVLQSAAPDEPIDVLAPGWSVPIVARMPEVRQAIELPVGHGELRLGVRRAVARRLRPAGYGQALVLPRSAKAALVPWLARIPRRTGYRGEFRYGLINDVRAFDGERLDQTVKRFVNLGLDAGAPLPEIPAPELRVDAAHQADALERLVPGQPGPVVGLLPGAEYGPAKCWPVEHFAATARTLVDEGVNVWLLGGPGDRDTATAIAAAAGVPVSNLCGETSLADAIDLLAACRAVVTNDSGLMHVAAAVGTHVIALYGSSSPAFTPPLTQRAHVHHLALECSPCFARECPLGHLNCLRELAPAHVLSSVRDALAD